MTGNGRSSIEDQILTAIDFGHLSYDETERRLQQLIDLEVNQTERPADPVLLDHATTSCSKCIHMVQLLSKAIKREIGSKFRHV